MFDSSIDLPQVDITLLATYLKKASEISKVSKAMSGVYLQDLVIGQDVANTLLAKAINEDLKAKSALDYSESVAYLEKASDFLTSRKIKDSSEARKRYVDIDVDVLSAKDRRAKTEALVSLLKGKCNVLRQAHDDLKKLHFSDQYGSSYAGE